jgi:hypothetical protein
VERRTRRTDRTCLTSHTGHSPASPGDRATARRQPRRRGGLAFPPSFLLSHGDADAMHTAQSMKQHKTSHVGHGQPRQPAGRRDFPCGLVWRLGPAPPSLRVAYFSDPILGKLLVAKKKAKKKEWIRRPKRGRSEGLMVGGPLLSRAYYSMKFSNSNSLILSLVKHTNPT